MDLKRVMVRITEELIEQHRAWISSGSQGPDYHAMRAAGIPVVLICVDWFLIEGGWHGELPEEAWRWIAAGQADPASLRPISFEVEVPASVLAKEVR